MNFLERLFAATGTTGALVRVKLLLLFVFIHIVQIPLSLVWLWGIFFDPDRAWKTSLAYDRMANAEVNGDPSETISSRAGFGMERGSKPWCVLCKFLDLFEKDHCQKAKGW
jgi:hypothetical protein